MSTTTNALKKSAYRTREEYNTSAFILDDNAVVVNPKNDSRKGYSRARSAVIKLVSVLVAAIVLLLVGIAAPSSQAPARADCSPTAIVTDPAGCVESMMTGFTDSVKGIFCAVGASNGSYPESAWAGTSGIFSLNNNMAAAKTISGAIRGLEFDASKPYTAYEKYGTAGTNWTFNREEIDGIQDYSCFPVDKLVANLSANSIFSITEAIVGFTGWVYGFAIGHDSFSDLIDAVDKVLGNGNDQGLISSLYLNYLTPLIIIGSLWLFWYAFVKRAVSVATTGIIWMILSPIVSLGILYNASGLISLGNGLIQGLVTETTGAIGGATTNARASMPNDVGDLCNLPGAKVDDFMSDSSGQVQRVVSCRIWEAFVYYPWATGQYGIPPTQGNLQAEGVNTTIKLGPGNEQRMDLRAAQLDSQTLDYTLSSAQIAEGAPKKKQEVYKKIEEHMTTSDETELLAHSWVGNEGMNRVSIAIFSIIAVIGGTIVIVSISISMIIYQLGTIFLMLVAPLFLLLGIHPGFGRGIALKWAELLVESILKRVVLAIFLSVLIAIFMFLVGNTGQVGFIETIFLLVALSIAGMRYKSKFLDLVGNLQFGGTQTGMESGRGKVRSALLGTAGAAAGVIGAVGGMGSAASMAKAGAVAKGAGKAGQMASVASAAVKAGAKPAYGGYIRGSHSQSGAGALTKGFMGGRNPFTSPAAGAAAKGAGAAGGLGAGGIAGGVAPVAGGVAGGPGGIGGIGGVAGMPPRRPMTPEEEASERARESQRQFLVDQEKARQDMKDGLLYGVSMLLANVVSGRAPNAGFAPTPDGDTARPHGWQPREPIAGKTSSPLVDNDNTPKATGPVPNPTGTPRAGGPGAAGVAGGVAGVAGGAGAAGGRPNPTGQRPEVRGRRISEEAPTIIEGTVIQPEERAQGKAGQAGREKPEENTVITPDKASAQGSSARNPSQARSQGQKKPNLPKPGAKGQAPKPNAPGKQERPNVKPAQSEPRVPGQGSDTTTPAVKPQRTSGQQPPQRRARQVPKPGHNKPNGR